MPVIWTCHRGLRRAHRMQSPTEEARASRRNADGSLSCRQTMAFISAWQRLRVGQCVRFAGQMPGLVAACCGSA